MTNHIWSDFLSIAQHEVGVRVVETWLKAIELIRWDARQQVVYLRAPNAFVKDWVSTHYMMLFYTHLTRLLGVNNVSVVFVDSQPGTEAAIIPARLVPTEQDLTATSLVRHSPQIHATYQFNTFVVGPSNSLSYAAALAVTEKPGLVYNPLFVYGSSGLGKTHLLHAIGNEIRHRFKKLVVLYQPADRFVNEFIHAIRFNKIDVFKDKYKKIDVLLIDDIQFMAHKDQTQEAFFHIFNALYESSKQIVCSSDLYPRDLQGIAQRLRSRLEWGLVTDVQTPTIEEKIAIVKRKAVLSGQEITDEVAEFLAQQAPHNIRELEGALIRVCAFASLTQQSLTLELVRKVLVRPILTNEKRTITLEAVAGVVAKQYGYTLADLRSSSRNRDIALSRHVAMYLMKRVTDKSLQEIGAFLRRSDHTTVAHAIVKVQHLVLNNEPLNALLCKMEQQIRS